jgi:hypothetical protein
MRKVFRNRARSVVAGLALAWLLALSGSAWAQENSQLMVTDGVNKAHIFPTVDKAAELVLPPSDTGPLIYHAPGPVMTGSLTFYAIYWIPAHLQNGNSTVLSSHYQSVETDMLHDYGGHGIGNNSTQYYQQVSGTTTWIQNRGQLGATYVDTHAYPASGCQDPATPGNCITDAQLRTELQRVMNLKGWTGGISKMFLIFTSSGEGSCFDASGNSCAYTAYCAYHSFIDGSTPIIYGNEPYGDTSACQVAGTPSPNNDPAADTAATAASHEMTEAITDPELDAWYTAQGNEIGDLCAYNYGTNGYDSSKANQHWNAHYYELQTEFDNHKHGCEQLGP